MKEKKLWGKKLFGFLRVMIVAYLITGALLLLLAFVLYKWQLSETMMAAGTLVIYILSCFASGMLIGKSGRTRAFVWGLGAGVLYYMILLAIALMLPESGSASATTMLLNMVICAASGMTGAMVFRK